MTDKKKVLGLDLGTNSIGWAIIDAIQIEDNLKLVAINKAGCRIIPMEASTMGDFEAGNSVSQTKDRTKARGIRRMNERRHLRRERLNRVLNTLGWLPPHYSSQLNRYGQIKKGEEPKLAWNVVDGVQSFLFKDAFSEMCEDFRRVHPDLLANGKLIAYDWTIYYLRKKALTSQISAQELAWILSQVNQKRGYYAIRGKNEEENNTQRKEFYKMKVIDVRDTGEESKGKKWYDVVLENGWTYKRQSACPLDWIGKEREFIVTTKLTSDGKEATDRNGLVKRSFSSPKEDDWYLRKIRTDNEIEASGKTVGEFIYDALLTNPDEKIIGKLVRVVDRKLYKKEIRQIIHKQLEFHREWHDSNVYKEAVSCLYPTNKAYRDSIENRNLEYLLIDDILFYQRPLKSKKALISDCSHEYHAFIDKSGVWKREYLKCIPKSHPVYEEFRAWQFVHNLAIVKVDPDSTAEDIIWDDCDLVEWLLSQIEVSQKQVVEHLMGRKLKRGEILPYRWNYVEDKTFPMGSTSAFLKNALIEFGGQESEELILKLWHILYSVTDQQQLNRALSSFEVQNGLSDGFAKKLCKVKPYGSDYGAYSQKATKKLLTLMRSGKAWSWNAIDSHTQNRIDKLLGGEYDGNISERVRKKLISFSSRDQFQGLPLWLAEYVVYDIKDTEKWNCPEDIDTYIHKFRLHSLNNPIVEQVVMETLRVVRDIWREQGRIDEIHLELARELKKNAEQRKVQMERQRQNESANLRAKRMLIEMMNPDMDIDSVRGHSPSQLELFRLYEDDILSANEVPEDIQKIITSLSSVNIPSHSEIRRYRLWLDQKYRSPYTGGIIPLARLFTPAYQIEHIIPQSRFFDDSYSNKVICEAEVNLLKDRQLAHEFIKEHGGEIVTLSGGKTVKILTTDTYEREIKKTFAGNRQKLEKLMLDEIPKKFVQRQLNDSRYISRLMKSLLSNIVRSIDPLTGKFENEETSRNLIVTNGSITDRLKKDWAISDVWNRIILPRFERMNKLMDTDIFTSKTANGNIIPNMPLELQSGFSKKRIDHRHHAMDAIVIACTTRNHVNLLNNESAMPENSDIRFALNASLRIKGSFIKPWDTFTQDTEDALRSIIVSSKQNLRVINKSSNYFQRFNDEGRKVMTKQTKGDNWSIRKSMHKDTVFGMVNLQFIKTTPLGYAIMHIDDIVDRRLRIAIRSLVSEGKDEKQIKKFFSQEKNSWEGLNLGSIEMYFYSNETTDRYYATRLSLDSSFNTKYIQEKVTDSGIRKILLFWLEMCEGKPEIAFSPEGIEKMNANIRSLNGGSDHKPIHKVRIYEKAVKYPVGSIGAKAKKFVEADKGTRLFTMVFQDDGRRELVPLGLKDVIFFQKQYGRKNWVNEMVTSLKEKGICTKSAAFLFILSPGDLVYHPSEGEIKENNIQYHNSRIYRVVSLDGKNPNFILNTIAKVIVNGQEFTKHNKTSRGLDGRLIKETCIPISVDRLGNIVSND